LEINNWSDDWNIPKFPASLKHLSIPVTVFITQKFLNNIFPNLTHLILNCQDNIHYKKDVIITDDILNHFPNLQYIMYYPFHYEVINNSSKPIKIGTYIHSVWELDNKDFY
jgi:hypothetical protein